MKRLATISVLSFVLLSGFLCTGSQIHKAKLANADISTALNKVTKTIIQLTQEGTMAPAEEATILPHISDATILADQMEACTNMTATASVVACASPLFTALQTNLTAASFGLKNPNAQAIYTAAIGGVQVALDEFKSAGGIK